MFEIMRVHYILQSISSYSGSRRGSDESDGSEVSSNLSQDPKDYIRELRVGNS